MSGDFEFAGFDPNARRVLLSYLETFAQLRECLPPHGRFVLFLGGDSAAVSTAELYTLAEEMLDRGAVYVVAWGAGCERVETTFDEAIAARDSSPDGPTIMTTSYPEESIRVAITFATTFAVATEEYRAETVIIALVGLAQAQGEVEACLEDLLEDEAPVAEGE